MRRLCQILVFLLILLVTGCISRQEQAQSANAIAAGANAALPLLVNRYDQEGVRAIDQAKSADEANAAIARIKDKWFPVWHAWETMKVAQDHWATVLEQGGDLGAALKEMQKAYCRLVAIWPEDVMAVPLAPIACHNLVWEKEP